MFNRLTLPAALKPASLISAAVMSLSLAASAVANEITIEHSQGSQAFTQVPSNIVSFDLASLDTLNALDVEVNGVVKAFLPRYLAEYSADKYTNVGSLFEPDYEVVASMEPDLIIIANRSSGAFAPLSELAPTIDLTVWGDGFLEQFKKSVRSLGKLFQKEAEAEARLAAIEHKVTLLNEHAPSKGNALIVLIGGGKLTAFGSGSRFGWLHDELGVVPAIDDVNEATHGDPISYEFILKTNPDWLFVLDRDSAIGENSGAAQAVLENEIMKKTKAVQKGQVVYLDAVNWYIVMSGLQAVEQSIDEIMTALSITDQP